MNRNGELVDMIFSESMEDIRERLQKTDAEIAGEAAAIEEAATLASEISEMILKINSAKQPGDQKRGN